MKSIRISFIISVCMLVAFALWTIGVCFVDVKPVGPNGTSVGFASINSCIHNMTGVHMMMYNITDWLGLVPFFVCVCFGFLGIIQWVKRRSIKKVDFSLFVLGSFYLVTIAVYLFFEYVVINYRPVLIEGFLEASYPSSTTVLVMCVMPTAIMQLNSRIKSRLVSRIVSAVIIIFIVFMVICRFISGVHWFSDIVGGVLLSAGLVMLYYAITNKNEPFFN